MNLALQGLKKGKNKINFFRVVHCSSTAGCCRNRGSDLFQWDMTVVASQWQRQPTAISKYMGYYYTHLHTSTPHCPPKVLDYSYFEIKLGLSLVTGSKQHSKTFLCQASCFSSNSFYLVVFKAVCNVRLNPEGGRLAGKTQARCLKTYNSPHNNAAHSLKLVSAVLSIAPALPELGA